MRECGAKEVQLNLILVIVIFPINVCKFVLHETLIKMRGDYVLICRGGQLISCSLAPLFPSNNQSRTQLFRQLIRG